MGFRVVAVEKPDDGALGKDGQHDHLARVDLAEGLHKGFVQRRAPQLAAMPLARFNHLQKNGIPLMRNHEGSHPHVHRHVIAGEAESPHPHETPVVLQKQHRALQIFRGHPEKHQADLGEISGLGQFLDQFFQQREGSVDFFLGADVMEPGTFHQIGMALNIALHRQVKLLHEKLETPFGLHGG